jgi:hypothetical protein
MKNKNLQLKLLIKVFLLTFFKSTLESSILYIFLHSPSIQKKETGIQMCKARLILQE